MDVDKEASNVVQFAPKRQYVWEHRCGAQEFFLHRDGSIECPKCHEFIEDLCWGQRSK